MFIHHGIPHPRQDPVPDDGDVLTRTGFFPEHVDPESPESRQHPLGDQTHGVGDDHPRFQDGGPVGVIEEEEVDRLPVDLHIHVDHEQVGLRLVAERWEQGCHSEHVVQEMGAGHGTVPVAPEGCRGDLADVARGWSQQTVVVPGGIVSPRGQRQEPQEPAEDPAGGRVGERDASHGVVVAEPHAGTAVRREEELLSEDLPDHGGVARTVVDGSCGGIRWCRLVGYGGPSSRVAGTVAGRAQVGVPPPSRTTTAGDQPGGLLHRLIPRVGGMILHPPGLLPDSDPLLPVSSRIVILSALLAAPDPLRPISSRTVILSSPPSSRRPIPSSRSPRGP